jgi:clan AA aspartic protease (TIGR02281 family)
MKEILRGIRSGRLNSRRGKKFGTLDDDKKNAGKILANEIRHAIDSLKSQSDVSKFRRRGDAVLPIEAWVSLNPKHDTSQTRTIIANYMTKGRCATGTRGSAEAFAVPRLNNVVNLPVTINGIRGTFVLDSGATFVSLKNSFAQKAGVEIDQASIVRLRTANGIVDGKRGRAQTIQLRSLLTKDVPIVVHSGAYGDGIDGLLGMSFLSRFNIIIDGKTVRISPRKAR